MPSTRIPSTAVNPTTGVPAQSGGGTNSAAALAVHISDPTAAHAASAISTANLPPWSTGNTNLASNVQFALAKMITDLTTDDGGAPIIFSQSPGTWYDGSNVGSAGSLYDILFDMIQDLGTPSATVKLGGNQIQSAVEYGYGTANIPVGSLRSQLVALMAASNHVFSGGAAWADGSSNGQQGLQAFLNSLLTSLSGTAGAAKIGAAATNGFTAGSIRTQLNEIAPGSAGTAFSAPKTFNGTAGDTNAVFLTTAVPTDRKLLWEINAGATQKIRFYASSAASVEITTNARWDGTQWNRDSSTASARVTIGVFTTPENSDLLIQHRSNLAATWLESEWNDPPLYINANGVTSSQGVSNMLTPKNLPKSWGNAAFTTGDNSNPSDTADDGFNITSMSTASNDVLLTFADDFADTDYIVLATCDNYNVGPVSTGKAVGSCRMQLYDRASGASVDAETATFRFQFVAYGDQ